MRHERIEKLLTAAIGLEPASVGESTIVRSVHSRMLACGVGLDDYIQHLQESTDEMQRLIEEVVVPDTWFFRDPETFQVLGKWAVGRESLRILSIGCCTGEEPYAIAMCLLDAGLEVDRFEILGVDVSDRALKYAVAGMYRQRSFRTEDQAFRDRYFQHTGRGYLLSDAVRAPVHFMKGNVLGAPSTLQGEYHVIFCRNVLIYLDHAAQRRAIRNLQGLLHQDGILFVGPAESHLILENGFAAFGPSRGFVRDRRLPNGLSDILIPERRRPVPVPPLRPQPQPPLLQPKSDPRTSADLNDAARLANAGRLADAAEICKFYMLETGPSSQAYYLLGVVFDAMDRKAEAASHYRKALYLEPNHIEALTQLALITETMGEEDVAIRLRERIRRARERGRR